MLNAVLYIIAVIFGLAVGSFLNAYIWRLKTDKSVWKGRSVCVHCQHTLKAADLIPVVSFLMLRGRCRYCGKKISWQYPLVEIGAAAIFALILYVDLANGQGLYFLLRDWYFAAVLIIIFVYDFKWNYILDRVTLPAIVITFCLNILLGFYWLNLMLAAVIGASFFMIQYLVSKGRWIGGGDIRMGALMGFMLGWPNILVGLFIAYLAGAAVAIALVVKEKKKMNSTIAMGTFLAIGTLVALLWGNNIMIWYLGL